tara:strand:+ start:250 stop:465 length:216 start_codon:yes stop_codon:yes gene_type:complete
MSFSKIQLNRLLNTACELLMQLEYYADSKQQERINAWFDEINCEDDVDREIKDWKADMEAQDFDTFGKRKI